MNPSAWFFLIIVVPAMCALCKYHVLLFGEPENDNYGFEKDVFDRIEDERSDTPEYREALDELEAYLAGPKTEETHTCFIQETGLSSQILKERPLTAG